MLAAAAQVTECSKPGDILPKRYWWGKSGDIEAEVDGTCATHSTLAVKVAAEHLGKDQRGVVGPLGRRRPVVTDGARQASLIVIDS